ncbi:GFA family protein [Aidingimonas lacisalsi]|uniref:GFA family protein n=1 Tax=Aidingimonas lacisalsi TaxID=2604086 RepID=UPI00137627C4
MITGSCHCSDIEFCIHENELTVRYCYCTTCRKLSGSDYSSVARVARPSFTITKGAESLAAYESRPGKLRYYCSKCFSPIYVTTDNELSFLRVRLGLLDGSPRVKVTGHMWVSEKPTWRTIEDCLPVYMHEYTGE